MASHFGRRTNPTRSGVTALAKLAPVSPLSPTRVIPSPYVGRVREQKRGLDLLRQRGIVAVTGGDGSGKTALITSIVAELALPVYWIDLLPGLNDSIESCLWQLALPLDQLAPDVWLMLHRMQQSTWAYPAIVPAQMILGAYAALEQEVVLCIDLHRRIADLPLESLIVGICDYIAQTHHSQIKLIIEGTSLPYKVGAYASPRLQGLPPDIIQLWGQQLALNINDKQSEQIYQQTAGLPQAVALLFELLKTEPEQTSLDLLIANPAIRRFVRYLLSPLAPTEQEVVAQLAAESQQGGLLSMNTRAVIELLEDRQLAAYATGTVWIHPLIRSYYQFYQGG